ncbi:MAG: hypothetical protein KAX49_03745 [Halanaerobiales bacterium]|nr:hypothetical protein [Halanaerobiales bacterium]
MSTKIYTAYRFPKELGLFNVMSKIYEDGLEVVIQRMRKYYNILIIEQGKTIDEAHEVIIKYYKEAVVSSERNPLNFDMKIGIHEYEEYYYIIPYGEMDYEQWDFLDDNLQLEDFAYWNNTDKPKEITNDEWDERERIWNAMFDTKWIEKQLILVISEYDDFWRISPWLDLKREEYKKEKEKNNV